EHGDRDQPQTDSRRHSGCRPLAERYAYRSNGESEDGASGVAHERSNCAVEAKRKVEEEKASHNREQQGGQAEYGRSVANDREGSEREECQATGEPVDAVDHVESVNQRQDKE